MKITDELMSELQKLARIELSEAQREKCREDMRNIVSYMNILDELDAENLDSDPQSFSANGAIRDDEVLSSACRDDILKNVPRSKNGYFEVPKTVD